MPNMQALAARHVTLTDAQMPEHGTLYRQPAPTPSASGGSTSAPATGGEPIVGRLVTPTQTELSSGAQLYSRAPDAAFRAPRGSNLQSGDRIRLDDGRSFEVLGAGLDTTLSSDERALVALIGARP